MITLRQLRNFWILGVATIVLACFSDAVAQASYKVPDLGVQHPDNLGMAMGLNNHGWTVNMDQLLDPFSISLSAHLVQGTVRINIGELNIDSARLEERTVGSIGAGSTTAGNLSVCPKHLFQIRMVKTFAVLAHTLRVVPFLWRNGHMSALPTVGGNNGQASAINNRGQIVGYAENGIVDSTCPAGTLIIGLTCRCCGTKAKPKLFLRSVAIQTGSHSASTIKAKP